MTDIPQTTAAEKHVLWDLPTRIFHWSIAALIPLAWWSAEEGDYERHAWVGYSVFVLVLFRIVWGFVGSRHSRFSDFVRGPGAVISYLRRGVQASPGHSPLGALSVLVLLTLLLLQSFSGLFNTDEVFFTGPFHYGAPGWLRDNLGAWHATGFDVLLGFIGLHLAAIAWYQFRRGQPLIQAMIMGATTGRRGLAPAASLWRALLVLAGWAGLLWLAIEAAPKPQPMW
ncbi:MAG: cytochrome b/b6 domain-containing protein [Pseudomonadota bacterium]